MGAYGGVTELELEGTFTTSPHCKARCSVRVRAPGPNRSCVVPGDPGDLRAPYSSTSRRWLKLNQGRGRN